MKRRVAGNISAAIDASELSVAEIARRMDGNERAVRRWRDGDVSPSQENLARLATVLGVSDLTWFYIENREPEAEAV